MSSEANTPSLAITPEEDRVIDSNMSESESSDQAYGRAESSSSIEVVTRRSSSATAPPSKRLKTRESAKTMADDALPQAPDAPLNSPQQPSPSSPSGVEALQLLPEELWRDISELLDTPDLQSFRQVCKLFASLGLDLMMETINLVGTQKNYDQLIDKLRNPSALGSIQRKTKTLRIFTMHTEVQTLGEYDSEDERITKILDDYDNVRWNLGDRQILENVVHFPLLDKIVIKGAMFAEDWLQPLIDGIEVGSHHSRVVESLHDDLRVDMNGKTLACAAIAIHKHKLTPRVLQAETGSQYLADEETRHGIQYLFRHLEDISLYINVSDIEHPWLVFPLYRDPEYVRTHPQRYWAQCFEVAECVETISIAFEWDELSTWESTSLEHWFGTTQWEHLHTLNLVNLKCDSDSLLRVIHRNGSSLRNLSFTTLAVGPGQLLSFFRTLREYTEAGEIDLESLKFEDKLWEVTNLDDVTAEETHFYYSVDALPNLDDPTTQQYKENGHWPEGWQEAGKELRDAVEEYVLCGGPEIWGLYTWPALVSQFYEVPETFLDVEEL